MHLGGRGAGLAGYRERRVLSGPQHDELLVMRLQGGVSGVGGVTAIERLTRAMRTCLPLPACIQITALLLRSHFAAGGLRIRICSGLPSIETIRGVSSTTPYSRGTTPSASGC
jgi:hypothetical protein